MKRSLLLFVLLSGSGFAAVIGICVPSHMGALVIGNPCAAGDQMFSNFTDTGDVEASGFQTANAGKRRGIPADSGTCNGVRILHQLRFHEYYRRDSRRCTQRFSGGLPHRRRDEPSELLAGRGILRVAGRGSPGANLRFGAGQGNGRPA